MQSEEQSLTRVARPEASQHGACSAEGFSQVAWYTSLEKPLWGRVDEDKYWELLSR